MSRQRIHWDTPERDRLHLEKLARKVERIGVLKALVEMWEEDPAADHQYLLELKARLRSAEHQLLVMRPPGCPYM